jgi:hypothetical protein
MEDARMGEEGEIGRERESYGPVEGEDKDMTG